MVIRRIDVDGADQIAAAMRKASIDLERKMDQPHQASASLIEGLAQSRVPRRTGTLAASLFARASNQEGEAGVGPVVYAGVIHFGTPNKRGRPANISPNKFLYEAGTAAEPGIEDVFEAWVIKTVKVPIDALP